MKKVRKQSKETEEKQKGPRQRALLSVKEVQTHHDIRNDLYKKLKRCRTRAQKDEVSIQIRNINSELVEHWNTMPRNPVEDYSAFPRS